MHVFEWPVPATAVVDFAGDAVLLVRAGAIGPADMDAVRAALAPVRGLLAGQEPAATPAARSRPPAGRV